MRTILDLDASLNLPVGLQENLVKTGMEANTAITLSRWVDLPRAGEFFFKADWGIIDSMFQTLTLTGKVADMISLCTIGMGDASALKRAIPERSWTRREMTNPRTGK